MKVKKYEKQKNFLLKTEKDLFSNTIWWYENEW